MPTVHGTGRSMSHSHTNPFILMNSEPCDSFRYILSLSTTRAPGEPMNQDLRGSCPPWERSYAPKVLTCISVRDLFHNLNIPFLAYAIILLCSVSLTVSQTYWRKSVGCPLRLSHSPPEPAATCRSTVVWPRACTVCETLTSNPHLLTPCLNDTSLIWIRRYPTSVITNPLPTPILPPIEPATF